MVVSMCNYPFRMRIRVIVVLAIVIDKNIAKSGDLVTYVSC